MENLAIVETPSDCEEGEFIPARSAAALLSERRVRYPHVRASLLQRDGLAIMVLGRRAVALQHAGVNAVEIQRFVEDAACGDTNHMLRTMIDWVTVS